MKFVALRAEQMIFDSEEEAVAFYQRANDPEPKNQRHIGAEDYADKILICRVECTQVLVPALASKAGGDEHFVNYADAQAKREAELDALSGQLGKGYASNAMGAAAQVANLRQLAAKRGPYY